MGGSDWAVSTSSECTCMLTFVIEKVIRNTVWAAAAAYTTVKRLLLTAQIKYLVAWTIWAAVVFIIIKRMLLVVHGYPFLNCTMLKVTVLLLYCYNTVLQVLGALKWATERARVLVTTYTYMHTLSLYAHMQCMSLIRMFMLMYYVCAKHASESALIG